ncbi:MAG: hypothetical protein NT069_34620 [Planctomycetota bacterium]|nr:hypothetical protein [Planctomycetota bacterium]
MRFLLFPIYRNPMHWVEVLVLSTVIIGLTVVTLGMLFFIPFAALFLLLICFFSLRLGLAIWRRWRERIEVTPEELTWNLGFAQLRIPTKSIVRATLGPGRRPTSAGPLEVRLRMSSPACWTGTIDRPWWNWLIASRIPARSAGFNARDSVVMVQLAPWNPQALLYSLCEYCPNLAASSDAVDATAVDAMGFQIRRDWQPPSLQSPRRFTVKSDLSWFDTWFCVVAAIPVIPFGMALLMVGAPIGILPAGAGVLVLIQYLFLLWRNFGERIEVSESEWVWNIGYARLRIPLEDIVRLDRFERDGVPQVRLQTRRVIAWEPHPLVRLFWYWSGLFPGPSPASPETLRDDDWLRVIEFAPRNPELFFAQFFRIVPAPESVGRIPSDTGVSDMQNPV